ISGHQYLAQELLIAKHALLVQELLLSNPVHGFLLIRGLLSQRRNWKSWVLFPREQKTTTNSSGLMNWFQRIWDISRSIGSRDRKLKFPEQQISNVSTKTLL